MKNMRKENKISVSEPSQKQERGQLENNTKDIMIGNRKVTPSLAGRINERSNEMWSVLIDGIEKFKSDFKACGDLKKRILHYGEKVSDVRKQVKDADEKGSVLKTKLHEMLDGDGDSDKVLKQIIKNKAEIESLNMVLGHLEGDKITTLKADYEKAERDLSNKVYREVRTLKNVFSSAIDEKLQNEIEIDLLSWDLAVSQLNTDMHIRFPQRVSLFLSYNRNVYSAFLPPGSNHLKNVFLNNKQN